MSSETFKEKASSELYEKFFNFSLDLYCICRFDGFLQYANPAWTTTLGYSHEELLAKPVIEFVHPDDRAATLQEMERLFHGTQTVAFENRFIHKDGTFRWLCWKAVPDCNLELVFSSAYDATAEKLAQQKLRETESRLTEALRHEHEARNEAEAKTKFISEIFSQAPCLASFTSGPDHVFRFVNEAYSQLMGHRDLIGKSVKEAVPELDPSIFPILDKVYQTGERFIAEDLSVTGDWLADGHVTEKHFTTIYAPIMDSNHKPSGLWTLAFDITEQKRLESLVQITERVTALGRMAAGVAHEINNPLAYILGGLTVLKKRLTALDSASEESESIKDDVAKFVEKAESAAQRIRDIVKSLNRLSSETKDVLEPVDVQSVVNTALEYTKNETSYKALVNTNIENGLTVTASDGGLMQVLLNLIINASHAINKGSAEENEIRITARSEPDGKASIKVKDTGQGIPKENLDRIFDPFFTSKAVGVGSGLGLSISHEIIKSFGGTISVDSTPDIGTEFTLLLDRGTASHAPKE